MIHICIRETLDWSDEALVNEQLHASFRAKYDAWNRTFTMPYHRFRTQLSAIAADNLSRVAGATLSPIEAVPAGDLIVPVDDDDWFAPDLVSHLTAAMSTETKALLWTRLPLQPDRGGDTVKRVLAKLLGRRDKHVCKTNNYAIRNVDGLQAAALNHVTASRYVDAHPQQVGRIDRTLAIQNRSIASQTSLAWGRPTITSQELVALLGRYRNFYERWQPSGELSWAAPYVRLMARLMADIDVKRTA